MSLGHPLCSLSGDSGLGWGESGDGLGLVHFWCLEQISAQAQAKPPTTDIMGAAPAHHLH